MALATQCPHCQTTFRVAHDQLKLRAGLVRCGACKQIFNGIENLLRPEEAPPPVAAPPIPHTTPDASPAFVAPLPPEPANEDEPEASPDLSPDDVVRQAEFDRPEDQGVFDDASQTVDGTDDDPLQRMTLVNFSNTEESQRVDDDFPSKAPQSDPDVPDPLEIVIEDLQRKPLRGTRKSARKNADVLDDNDDDSEYQEPSFVRQGRRKQRFGRALRVFLAVGTLLLLAGMLAQVAYLYRDQLAARFPDTKPALIEACGVIGCEIGLPAQIEAVAIESTELQSLASEENRLMLSALLRNHGGIVQAWPHIELTLKDADEKPLARRVFGPADYVKTAQEIQKGLPPKSEHSVKIQFELAQLKAAGYRVYLFYP